jgi:hypothetical protein
VSGKERTHFVFVPIGEAHLMDNINSHHAVSAQRGYINYWAWLVGAPAAVLLMVLVSGF